MFRLVKKRQFKMSTGLIFRAYFRVFPLVFLALPLVLPLVLDLTLVRRPPCVSGLFGVGLRKEATEAKSPGAANAPLGIVEPICLRLPCIGT